MGETKFIVAVPAHGPKRFGVESTDVEPNYLAPHPSGIGIAVVERRDEAYEWPERATAETALGEFNAGVPVSVISIAPDRSHAWETRLEERRKFFGWIDKVETEEKTRKKKGTRRKTASQEPREQGRID